MKALIDGIDRAKMSGVGVDADGREFYWGDVHSNVAAGMHYRAAKEKAKDDYASRRESAKNTKQSYKDAKTFYNGIKNRPEGERIAAIRSAIKDVAANYGWEKIKS
jgi:hypothetical protein